MCYLIDWLTDWIIWGGGEETTCRILGKIKGESKYEHLVHACYSELHPHSSFIWHCCFSDCWIKNLKKKKYFFFFAIVHLPVFFPVTLQFYLLLSSQHFHTFQAASVTSKEWTILTDPIPSHLSSEEQRYWQEYGKLDEGCSLSWWRSWARQCFLLFFPSTNNPSPRGPLYQTKIITLLDQNQTKLSTSCILRISVVCKLNGYVTHCPLIHFIYTWSCHKAASYFGFS